MLKPCRAHLPSLCWSLLFGLAVVTAAALPARVGAQDVVASQDVFTAALILGTF